MTEKLIIKNFAGIKELEIEVKKVNVLIGPQASGKSICAKLLFYFKNFSKELLQTVENKQTKRHLDLNYLRTFEEYFPPDSWGKGDFKIQYIIGNCYIEISKYRDSKNKISIEYSELFHKELTELRRIKKLSEHRIETNVSQYNAFEQPYLVRKNLQDHLTKTLKDSICNEAAFSQLFIPAGRSFYAVLQKNIFSFISSNNALDPFLRDFGSVYENMKNIRLRVKPSFKDEHNIQKEIDTLIDKSLCGKHISVKGEDFLEIADGRRISIASSSSGQQETLPLTTVLSMLPFLYSLNGSIGQTVYIEEPEAHLFPSAQRSIVELIATIFNYRKKQLQFFITTHSPYVLTALNNLLQAGILYTDSPKEVQDSLEKIVPKYKSLNIVDLSAYALINGTCRSIICPETGLIDASIIDSVSDDLAIEFDKLLDLT